MLPSSSVSAIYSHPHSASQYCPADRRQRQHRLSICCTGTDGYFVFFLFQIGGLLYKSKCVFAIVFSCPAISSNGKFKSRVLTVIWFPLIWYTLFGYISSSVLAYKSIPETVWSFSLEVFRHTGHIGHLLFTAELPICSRNAETPKTWPRCMVSGWFWAFSFDMSGFVLAAVSLPSVIQTPLFVASG